MVEEACKSKNNHFGYGAWAYHTLSVVKYAKLLAKKLKADLEVVEMAALLHDYASVLDKDLYPDHHLHGARLAEEILQKYSFPPQKIKAIKDCILNHRTSKKAKLPTIEAKIIASADAMAHFDNLSSLFYLAFVQDKMDIEKGTSFVVNKLQRSWEKLLPEAKELLKEHSKAIKILFK